MRRGPRVEAMLARLVADVVNGLLGGAAMTPHSSGPL